MNREVQRLVDAERVALGGHSFGGQTAVRVPLQDDRFRAVLPMAPSYAPAKGIIDVGLPLVEPALVMGGELDATTPFDVDAAPLYRELVAPRFLVELLGAGHGAFSDLCGSPAEPACVPAEPDPAALQERIVRYAMGFLGRYAAWDRRWQALLDAGEGVVLEADP